MTDDIDMLAGGRAPTEAQILAQISDARERSSQERKHGIRAADVRYSAAKHRVVLTLTSGTELWVPVDAVATLRGLSPRDLADVEVSATGAALRWERLDIDLSVPAVVQEALGGASAAMGVLGAAGGAVKSALKADAARRNGAKGGRPKGTPVKKIGVRSNPDYRIPGGEESSIKVAAQYMPKPGQQVKKALPSTPSTTGRKSSRPK